VSMVYGLRDSYVAKWKGKEGLAAGEGEGGEGGEGDAAGKSPKASAPRARKGAPRV
jgi:hypothetical protein